MFRAARSVRPVRLYEVGRLVMEADGKAISDDAEGKAVHIRRHTRGRLEGRKSRTRRAASGEKSFSGTTSPWKASAAATPGKSGG